MLEKLPFLRTHLVGIHSESEARVSAASQSTFAREYVEVAGAGKRAELPVVFERLLADIGDAGNIRPESVKARITDRTAPSVSKM